MAAPTYGIKIVHIENTTVSFQVNLVNSDWAHLPRTHGFGFLMLTSREDCKNEKIPDWELTGDVEKDVLEAGKKYIKTLEVSNFQNYPIPEEFREEAWHAIDSKFTPNALYSMEVVEASLLEHLTVGDNWISSISDIYGAYWKLSYQDGTSDKFYCMYQNEMGKWVCHYGKTGTDGCIVYPFILTFDTADKRVKAKLKKGYTLDYKNFDTAFGFERPFEIEYFKDFKQPEGIQELQKAVESNDLKTAKALLESGVDCNAPIDEYGRTIINTYVFLREPKEYDVNIFDLMYEYGFNPNANYGGIMYEIFQSEAEEVANYFLNKGIDLEGEDPGALMYTAVGTGWMWLVKLLIEEYHMDVNATTNHKHFAKGLSPLMEAVHQDKNNNDMINYLLDQGANPNYRAPVYWGPVLFHAIHNFDSFSCLLKRGAKLEQPSEEGDYIIHKAAAMPGTSIDVFNRIIEDKEMVQKRNRKGVTPAQIIISRIVGLSEKNTSLGYEKLQSLLHHGETWHNLNADKIKPLTLLLENVIKSKRIEDYEEDIILSLIDDGFEPHVLDKQKRTLLHFGAKVNAVKIVEKCLALGVDKNSIDKKKMTALDYAKKFKSSECMALLN